MSLSRPVSLEPLKATEHLLHETTSLSRNLWAALVGAVFVVDDWCAGPLLAWRYKYHGQSLFWFLELDVVVVRSKYDYDTMITYVE